MASKGGRITITIKCIFIILPPFCAILFDSLIRIQILSFFKALVRLGMIPSCQRFPIQEEKQPYVS